MEQSPPPRKSRRLSVKQEDKGEGSSRTSVDGPSRRRRRRRSGRSRHQVIDDSPLPRPTIISSNPSSRSTSKARSSRASSRAKFRSGSSRGASPAVPTASSSQTQAEESFHTAETNTTPVQTIEISSDSSDDDDIQIISSRQGSDLIRRPLDIFSPQPLPRGQAIILTDSPQPKTILRMPVPSPPRSKPPPIKNPLLSTYSCPICLCAPQNMAVTPCGHVFCGGCIFNALKTQAKHRETQERAYQLFNLGGLSAQNRRNRDPLAGHCPVCRADIPGGFDRTKKRSIVGATLALAVPINDPREADDKLKL